MRGVKNIVEWREIMFREIGDAVWPPMMKEWSLFIFFLNFQLSTKHTKYNNKRMFVIVIVNTTKLK